MTDLKFRKMHASDYELYKSLAHEFPGYGNSALQSPKAFSMNMTLHHRAGRSLVALDGDVPVGYVFTTNRGMTDASTAVELQALAVLPDYRSRGIGAALLQRAVRKERAKGFSLIYAYISDSSADFYSSQGWSVGEPYDSFAWVQAPSFAQWEIEQSRGEEPEPRRKKSMVRFAEYSSNPAFPRMASLVLNERLINYSFFMPKHEDSQPRPQYRHLIHLALVDPTILDRLPEDVRREVSNE